MMKMSISKPVLAGLLLVVTLGNSACTRALRADYRDEPATATAPRAASIGVARFKDERAWVVAGDEKSSSFISSAGAWKFGISDDGVAYTPVNRYVQSVIVREFSRAGLRASALDQESDGSDAPALGALAASQKLDYALAGKVSSFEFANDAGMVTVTSRRTVNLQIALVKSGGVAPARSNAYQESEAENEGMGVLHGTNVDKLVNNTLRKAVQRIVKDVSTNLALTVREVQVQTADGSVWTYGVDEAMNVALQQR